MLVRDDQGRLGWIISPGFFDRLNAFCYTHARWLRRVYDYGYYAPRNIRPISLLFMAVIAVAAFFTGMSGVASFMIGFAGMLAIDIVVGVLAVNSPLNRADLTQSHYGFRVCEPILLGKVTSAQSFLLSNALGDMVRQEVLFRYDDNGDREEGVIACDIWARMMWRDFSRESEFENHMRKIEEVECDSWFDRRKAELAGLTSREDELRADLRRVARRTDKLKVLLANPDGVRTEMARSSYKPLT